jgi:cell division protein FtsB
MPRTQARKLRSPIAPQTLGRWGTRLVLLALLAVACGLMVGFVRMTWTRHQLNQARIQQAAINDEQRARNAALKGEAEYRESDVYAEQAAREQLGMAREGETVLLPTIVAPAEPQPTPASPSDQAAESAAVAQPETMPNYARWWRALFPETSVAAAP